MTSDGSKTPIRVEFEKPVVIPANSTHVVAATITGPQTWCGSKTVCAFQASGKIVFYYTERSTNGTDMYSGQIPELYALL